MAGTGHDVDLSVPRTSSDRAFLAGLSRLLPRRMLGIGSSSSPRPCSGGIESWPGASGVKAKNLICVLELEVLAGSFTRNNVGNPEQQRGKCGQRVTCGPRSGEFACRGGSCRRSSTRGCRSAGGERTWPRPSGGWSRSAGCSYGADAPTLSPGRRSAADPGCPW
jgi:hypothetical protein